MIDKINRGVYWLCRSLHAGVLVLIMPLMAWHVAARMRVSLSLPNEGDSGFLYYMAWLINEKGMMPFRDFEDTTFPGSYWLYTAITHFTGYSDGAFRAADLGIALFFACIAYVWLRPLGRCVAGFVPLAFAVVYYATTSFAMQRDYLALVLLVLSLLLISHRRLIWQLAVLAASILVAVTSLIKPHFAIGFPVLLAYGATVHGIRSRNEIWKLLGIAAAGCVFVYCVCFAWLYAGDGMAGFTDVVVHQLPLYMKLDGSMQEEVNQLSWAGLFDHVFAAAIAEWGLMLLAVGWIACQPNPAEKRILAMVLLMLALSYRVYIYLGMKGWDYHQLPYQFFFYACVALLLSPARQGASTLASVYHGICLLLFSVFLYLTWIHNGFLESGFWRQDLAVFQQGPTRQRPVAREALVQYLKQTVQQGETVQPRALGTYGPVLPAMMALELVPLYPRFPLSQIFYHHTDQPYVRQIQRNYLDDLERNPPDYILDDNGSAFFKSATGISPYPGYEAFLDQNYDRVYDNLDRSVMPDQFIVYRLK